MSPVASCARPQAIEARVKTQTPAMNRLRLPRTSPSRPMVITSTVSTMTYPLMTQPICASEACSPRRMSGIAMFTIVRSSSVMKKPRPRVSSTAHSLPRRLRMSRLPGQPAVPEVVDDGAEPVPLRAQQREQVLPLDQVHPVDAVRLLLTDGVQGGVERAELSFDLDGPPLEQVGDLSRVEQRREREPGRQSRVVGRRPHEFGAQRVEQMVPAVGGDLVDRALRAAPLPAGLDRLDQAR